MKKICIDRTGQLWLGRRCSLHLLLPLLFLSAYIGHYLTPFSISWGLALMHELSHILAGHLLGIGFSGVGLLPFGICARLREPFIASPAKEILMALAGPFANFAFALIGALLYPYLPFPDLRYAMIAALSIGLLNLLPCHPLDGGRILRATLTLATDPISAWKITNHISRYIIAVLLSVATFFLLTSSFQFSLLLIGVFLLGNLLYEQKTLSQQALRELLYYKEKPERSSLSRTDFLSAYKSLPARKILRKISYHKYYTVQVLDEKNRPVATLTEGQILDALLSKSIRLTLGEIAAMQ